MQTVVRVCADDTLEKLHKKLMVSKTIAHVIKRNIAIIWIEMQGNVLGSPCRKLEVP